jgi:ferredoxin/flavodoxin
VYFSATGTTRKIVTRIANTAASALGAEVRSHDFSLPAARTRFPAFGPEELVIFGVPVYAGRVPNLLLKQLDSVAGGGAPAAAVVLFGNRDFDDALVELRDMLQNRGFVPCAAGAFVGEHAFSTILGKSRPDEADMAKAGTFAEAVAQKILGARTAAELAPAQPSGTPHPYRGYYQPRDRAGNAIDIRKVKPVTGEKCTDCKLCAKICTMGSIDISNVREVPGICTKCCACVKSCPQGAKYFTDENFLYHQRELEAQYTRRAEPSLFV